MAFANPFLDLILDLVVQVLVFADSSPYFLVFHERFLDGVWHIAVIFPDVLYERLRSTFYDPVWYGAVIAPNVRYERLRSSFYDGLWYRIVIFQ